MSDFDRRQLRHFIAVAEELHFGRAAQRLHISQPPLSQSIAALEGDLGVRLFERNKRWVKITPAGKQFLQDARAILNDMTKAAARVRATAAGQAGVLNIGLNYSAPMHPAVSVLFRKFVKRHPDVRLELHQGTGASQLKALVSGTVDLCFMWPTRDDHSPDIVFRALDKDGIQLVCAEDSPLARKSRLAAKDLRGQPVFLMPWQMRIDFYDALIGACRTAGFVPEIRADIIQMPFVMNIIAAGQGITFVPGFLERIRPSGTVFRTCDFLPHKARPLPLSLACRAEDTSPLVKNFAVMAGHI